MPTWLSRRRKLLDQLKKQVALRVGPLDKELESYQQVFDKEFEGEWTPCLRGEMMDQLHRSSITLGSDFHPFTQSQRTHLRIIRGLKTPFILALECFESHHQDLLEDYMEGNMGDEVFLGKVQWDKNWGFPWLNYKALVDFAKAHAISVLAINMCFGEGSLEDRDCFMAQKIAEKWIEEKKLIYAIVGEYHVARDHLPKKISHLTGQWPMVIHQNSEKLYFEWAEKKPENQVEVMRGQEGKFCILSSPPWVKWQNYLIYLEKSHDKYVDLGDEESTDIIDYTDFVSSLIRFLAKDLGLKVDTSDLSVYSPVDQDHLERILLKKTIPNELEWLLWKMNNDRSFYFPQEGLVYLSRGTINHAAEMAGQYLHGKLIGRNSMFCHFPRDLIYSLWMEGVGYFMSKLVNYRRKTESLEDIRAMLAVAHPDDKGREALQLSLDQKMREVLATETKDLQKLTFQPQRKESYWESSHILGHMLGEKLYINYREKNLNLTELQELLTLKVPGENFLKKYLDLQGRLKKRKISIKESFI